MKNRPASLHEQRAIDEIVQAMIDARHKYGRFRNPWEAWGVLWEEADELWDLVKAYPKRSTLAEMRAEAAQVAAMALRWMLDLCDEPIQATEPVWEGLDKPSIEQVYKKPLKDLRIPEGYSLIMAGAIPCFRPVAKGDWFLGKLGDCAMYAAVSLPNDSRLILRKLEVPEWRA